jgi:hypothetical protein
MRRSDHSHIVAELGSACPASPFLLSSAHWCQLMHGARKACHNDSAALLLSSVFFSSVRSSPSPRCSKSVPAFDLCVAYDVVGSLHVLEQDVVSSLLELELCLSFVPCLQKRAKRGKKKKEPLSIDSLRQQLQVRSQPLVQNRCWWSVHFASLLHCF